MFPVHELLRSEAETATGLKPIFMGAMEESFQKTWRLLAPRPCISNAYPGSAEGAGAYGIHAIFFNTTGVNLLERFPPRASTDTKSKFPEGTFQTAAELRSVVASMAAGQHKVDLYIKHPGGVSIVRAGRVTVEGASLPAEWRPHLPPTFKTLFAPEWQEIEWQLWFPFEHYGRFCT